MTPLAQRMARMTPHTEDDIMREMAAELRHDMDLPTMQCFDVTEVYPAAFELAKNLAWKMGEAPDVFLPAPIVWLERQYPAGGRSAYLLHTASAPDIVLQGPRAEAQGIAGVRGQMVRQWEVKAFQGGDIQVAEPVNILFGETRMLGLPPPVYRSGKPATEEDMVELVVDMRLVGAYLAIINTPAIFKQIKHQPHAGLRRELLRSGALKGNQRQRPWVTVTMDISTPSDIEGGGGRMTGTKAMHFCRAHMRIIQGGRVAWVKGHWRGDASKGVHQHDYRVRA